MSLSACAAGRGDHPAGPATNWNAPLIDGITEPSVAAAQELVRFKVVAPGFGAPVSIQVDDPSRMPESERSVAFVFHLATYGTVVVEEGEQGGWTLARMRERASEPVSQGSSSTAGPYVYPFEMVPVRQTDGLLAKSGGAGSIMWIENNMLFNIFGPSITPEQVQALAAQL